MGSDDRERASVDVARKGGAGGCGGCRGSRRGAGCGEGGDRFFLQGSAAAQESGGEERRRKVDEG